jgi:hypothetical protein
MIAIQKSIRKDGKVMPDYFKKALRVWARKEKPSDVDDVLPFIKQWVDSLDKEMRRSKGDEEFMGELLEAASVYFTETFTEEEKADAFVYTLGLLGRK